MQQVKINRYKLKDNIQEADLEKFPLKQGGRFIAADVSVFLYNAIGKDISLNIGFPKDLSKWNDFDYITVIDDEFGQPFLPFYKYLDGTDANNVSPFLRRVIANYNKTMDSYEFLEKLNEKSEQ